MKFLTTIFFILSSTRSVRGANTCISAGDVLTLSTGCDYDTFEADLQSYLDEHYDSCSHDASSELRRIYSNKRGARNAINNLCQSAWGQVTTSKFSDVNETFTDSFMNEFVAGGTYLNTETGTFRNTNEGDNVQDFYDNEAVTTLMKGIPSLSQCDYQSIMCCYGRDRQANDNNGDCDDPYDERCVDADPGHNSDLCYVESTNPAFPDPFLFPNESEDDIYCHGFAWAEDANDFTSQLRFNNFFYLSLYDQLFTRGYVEPVVDSDNVPMCGCIENMPKVSRASCTEMDVSTDFAITFNGDSFEVTSAEILDIDYGSCEGISPSDGETTDNNDLASHVFKLHQEGKVADSVKEKIYETLVGYENNDSEEACIAAYEANYGTYPEETIENRKCSASLFQTEDDDSVSIEECQDLCHNTKGCKYFSYGITADSGICVGCAESTDVEDHDGYNTYKMNFSLSEEDVKCQPGTENILFRTPNNSPLTLAECHQMCQETEDCHYFTLGIDPQQSRLDGVCMGCKYDSAMKNHQGFNLYVIH